ncbi:DNA repair protein RecO [Cellulomonas sp. NTE-D12]|uniref:DNA repair protein RecO n=1 Tax=Cellulomonas sp. NTE-D12 TaxID=2962632 RepID=UPI0030813607|nr:hypothetical protein CELD12_15820 [Cellulomonas sp. NTE-D12]
MELSDDVIALELENFRNLIYSTTAQLDEWLPTRYSPYADPERVVGSYFHVEAHRWNLLLDAARQDAINGPNHGEYQKELRRAVLSSWTGLSVGTVAYLDLVVGSNDAEWRRWTGSVASAFAGSHRVPDPAVREDLFIFSTALEYSLRVAQRWPSSWRSIRMLRQSRPDRFHDLEYLQAYGARQLPELVDVAWIRASLFPGVYLDPTETYPRDDDSRFEAEAELFDRPLKPARPSPDRAEKSRYRDEAVILRVAELGEADSLVTMLTRNHGNVRAVVKGARRVSSRFGQTLVPFQCVDLQVHAGRHLAVIIEAEVLGAYASAIAAKEELISAATEMVRIADELLLDAATPSQYALLKGALGHLAAGRGEVSQTLTSYAVNCATLAAGRDVDAWSTESLAWQEVMRLFSSADE